MKGTAHDLLLTTTHELQVAPGLGGVAVTRVRPGGAGDLGGLIVTDRIIGLGDGDTFPEKSWVEVRDFHELVASSGRPVKLRFLRRMEVGSVPAVNTAPPPSDEEFMAGAWGKIFDFIRATPERARSIGDLFTSFDTEGDVSKCEERREPSSSWTCAHRETERAKHTTALCY